MLFPQKDHLHLQKYLFFTLTLLKDDATCSGRLEALVRSGTGGSEECRGGKDPGTVSCSPPRSFISALTTLARKHENFTHSIFSKLDSSKLCEFCIFCVFLSDPGVPGVRSMGPVLSHSLSPTPFADLTDVTLTKAIGQ